MRMPVKRGDSKTLKAILVVFSVLYLIKIKPTVKMFLFFRKIRVVGDRLVSAFNVNKIV